MQTRSIITLITATWFCWQSPKAQVAAADQQKLQSLAPEKATAVPKHERTLLIFQKTSGWTPPQRALVDTAMSIMGRKTGAWRIGLITEDATVMAPETLAKYDAILMNNCNELTLSESQSKALQDFVKGGKGVVGLGSTISIRNWPEESEMWSGFCYRHPTKGVIAMNNEDPTHPLTNMWNAQGPQGWEDNWYIVYSPTSYSRDKIRVLLSYKWGPTDGPAKDDFSYPYLKTGDYAIAYMRTYGKGRALFNDFMHLKASPLFQKESLRHLADATQWALGDLELNAQQSEPGPAFTPKPFTGSLKGDPSKIPDILTRIKAGEAKAVTDLAKVMPDARASTVYPDILKMLVATGSWYISQDAAMGLRRMGEYGKPLAPLIAAKLNDPDAMNRTKLLYALEEMGAAAAEAIPAMKTALADPDWIVRQGAAEALGNVGAAAVPTYLEMLANPAWFTRYQAVQGLGRSGDATKTSPAAMTALKAALYDADPEVVNGAHRALAQLGTPVGLSRPMGSVAARKPVTASFMLGPVSRFSLPAEYTGIAKQVSLYNPEGKLLGGAVSKGNTWDLRQDFGLNPGLYLIRIAPAQ